MRDMYCKIRRCGPSPGNPGGHEGEGRGGFDLVSCSREREVKKGKSEEGISYGSIRILRTNVTRHIVVESLAEDDAMCLTYIIENQTGRRDVIFKSSREIAGSCDLTG